jgi:hypothetical protein
MHKRVVKEFPANLILPMLFDSVKTVVRSVLNSPGLPDRDQLDQSIENAFRLIWRGLAKE